MRDLLRQGVKKSFQLCSHIAQELNVRDKIRLALLLVAATLEASLAHEAKVPLGPRSATEFALGHNVGSKAEVDAVMVQVQQAGATITDPPHNAFWGGYTGSFQDPDGHIWEVAWNPDWELPD